MLNDPNLKKIIRLSPITYFKCHQINKNSFTMLIIQCQINESVAMWLYITAYMDKWNISSGLTLLHLDVTTNTANKPQ